VNIGKSTFIAKLFLILLFVLALIVILIQYFNFLHFEVDQQFGYLDPQLYWKSLTDFSNGKVLYRDLFYSYGHLNLLLRLPIFLIMGKTFLGSVVGSYIFLPILALILSIIIGKELLKGWPLLLYFALLVFYGVNMTHQDVRHLIPELGLILTMVGVHTQNERKTFIGSILLGVSIWGSVEYTFISFLSLGAVLLIMFYPKYEEIGNLIKKLFLFPLVSGLTFFLYLLTNNAFISFLNFQLSNMKSFYYASPCSAFYPRINGITHLASFIPNLQNYMVPIAILLLLGGTVIHRKKLTHFPIIFVTLLYSLFAFYRNIYTPCQTYLSYGLALFFLSLVFLVFSAKEKTMKKVVTILLLWFLIAPLFSSYIKGVFSLPIFSQKDRVKREYVPIAGIDIDTKLAKKYKEITNYIQLHTTQDDYVYDFPSGPYQLLAQRQSPVAVPTTYYFVLVPSLVDYTYKELQEKKPKLIVINRLNAINSIPAIHGLSFNIWSQGGSDIFIEYLPTNVETYIMQNYKVAKKYTIAWVLERREKSIQLVNAYLPLEQSDWSAEINGLVGVSRFQYQVIEDKPMISYSIHRLSEAELVKLPIKVDLGILKPFSKYEIEVFKEEKGVPTLLKNVSVWGQEQNIWLYLPTKIPSDNKIVLKFSDNKGFFFWGRPNRITISEPELFIYNSSIKADSDVDLSKED